MEPDWRHIIPPGHEKVISEGHCIDDCTRKSFPPQGISIFAVIMQTHNIGKEVKFRQVCLIYILQPQFMLSSMYLYACTLLYMFISIYQRKRI